MVELVDAIDSKSIIGNYVWVRVPLPAPTTTLIKSPNLLVGLFSYTFAKYSDIIITISDVFWVNLDVFINYNWSY